jgi:hypothetical protein
MNVIIKLNPQEKLILDYLLMHETASIEQLESIGIKCPTAVITGMRKPEILEIVSEKAHEEMLMGNKIQIPFKYRLVKSSITEGVVYE